MKKVFLDDLPKKQGWGVNKDKECVDWINSIGCKTNFIYDDLEGEIKIIDYNKKNEKLSIQYKNNIFHINTYSFYKCKLGNMLKKHTKQYKYNIGEIITTKSGKMQILKQIRIPNGEYTQKGYEYKCLIDGNIDKIGENHLNERKGCNVCRGLKVLRGYNDLWSTYPNIAQFLKHPEQGYNLTYQSNKLEIFICSDCGHEKSHRVCDIVNRNFFCSVCGDGISYPNKFIHAFLDQLQENYIPEYSPDWAYIEGHNNPKLNGKKKYDNLLSDRNEIWEIHGMQHYDGGFNRINKKARTLKEEQENDKLKKELAEMQGFKYIVIDARYSNMEYIRNSILNLPEIKRYDLSKINWLRCHEFACSSLVKVACDLWNSGIRKTKEIGKLTKISFKTIIDYLKQGAELGWCDYNPKDSVRRAVQINGKNNGKIIIQLTLKNEFIKEWESITSAKKSLNINNIFYCCKGKRNHAGGFKWMYKEDHEKYIAQQNKTNIQDCSDLEQSFSFA